MPPKIFSPRPFRIGESFGFDMKEIPRHKVSAFEIGDIFNSLRAFMADGPTNGDVVFHLNNFNLTGFGSELKNLANRALKLASMGVSHFARGANIAHLRVASALAVYPKVHACSNPISYPARLRFLTTASSQSLHLDLGSLCQENSTPQTLHALFLHPGQMGKRISLLSSSPQELQTPK